MYRRTAARFETLTVNDPYPSCHPSHLPDVRSHRDEFALIFCATSAMEICGATRNNECTWFAVPPIASASAPMLRTMPEVYPPQTWWIRNRVDAIFG